MVKAAKQIILLLLAISMPISEAAVKISKISVKNTTGFYVNATTNLPSRVLVRYGRSPTSLKISVADNVYKSVHRVDITGLNFGTKFFTRFLCSGRMVQNLTRKFFIT